MTQPLNSAPTFHGPSTRPPLMPRLRFTVRRMMVAVAIVGVVLGGVLLRQRSLAYRMQARWWAGLERPHFETAILRDRASERFASQVQSLRMEAGDNPQVRERMEIAARRSKRFAEIADDERA